MCKKSPFKKIIERVYAFMIGMEEVYLNTRKFIS